MTRIGEVIPLILDSRIIKHSYCCGVFFPLKAVIISTMVNSSSFQILGIAHVKCLIMLTCGSKSA